MNFPKAIRMGCWGLLALLGVATGTLAQAADPWEVLRQERAGTPEANQVLRLRQRDFSIDQVRQTLACLDEARQQRLPTAPLALRLEEGLAKNADPQPIVNALQLRLRTMVHARAMLDNSPYESHGEALVAVIGRALESGLPAQDLAAALQRKNGQAIPRIQSIIEAGESLHLAGLDPETTRTLMGDFLDHDLRRMEVLRAVRYSIRQHREGMAGPEIRRTLWGGGVDIEGYQGGRGGGKSRPAKAGGGGMGSGYGGARRLSAPGHGHGAGPGNGSNDAPP